MDNDDYTAKMTELIRLMRAIGNDTQQCEVKECAHKISTTITDFGVLQWQRRLYHSRPEREERVHPRGWLQRTFHAGSARRASKSSLPWCAR